MGIARTLICALALALCGCASGSGGPGNVLIVVNAKSPDSIAVGGYYASKRGIAPRFICKIDCPTSENIKQEIFETTIRDPIRKFLTTNNLRDQIDYIVLTRRIPIHTSDNWGVDSALACLFQGKPAQMHNPYYNAYGPFSHSEYNMYLVTRLDGLTLDDAKALVDRSLAAKPEKGLFLLDIDPNWDNAGPGYRVVNDGMRRAAETLKAKKFGVELDESTDFIVRDKIMGYYGWGYHDRNYKEEEYHKLKFLPGSIAETAVSTSAVTLTANRDKSVVRSYIIDLVSQGVTGAKGYIYEPYTDALADAAILFDRYTSGRNLAESFYAASRYVHWRDMVIGDPLCAPYAKRPPISSHVSGRG